MNTSYPYISGAGNITKIITQLRRSFPRQVTVNTLKQLGIASNNEKSVISALKICERN